MTEDNHEEPDFYGDPRINSGHAPIPRWILIIALILPIWGVVSLYVYWNGSSGWLDRGYWQQLQRAANTTYPYDQQQLLEKEQQK